MFTYPGMMQNDFDKSFIEELKALCSHNPEILKDWFENGEVYNDWDELEKLFKEEL